MGWRGEVALPASPPLLRATFCGMSAAAAAKGSAGRPRRLDAAVGPRGARLPCAARRRICAPRPARTALCGTGVCAREGSTAQQHGTIVGSSGRPVNLHRCSDGCKPAQCRAPLGPLFDHHDRFRKAVGASPAGRIGGGEPGHKQSSGLFVPGERPGACARCGLQGEQRRTLGPRVYSRASTSGWARVSEWHERSECNEFRARAKSLSSAGKSGPQGPAAASKPRRACARGLARATFRMPNSAGHATASEATRSTP